MRVHSVCLATFHASRLQVFSENECAEPFLFLPFQMRCIKLETEFPRNTISSTTASDVPPDRSTKGNAKEIFRGASHSLKTKYASICPQVWSE